jgi:short-subunit dehydrogenase
MDVILVARRRERLEALARRLQEQERVNAEVLVADLARPEGLRAVEARIAGEPALELLVNSAGFGGYMPFMSLDPDRAEELIHVQVLAVTRLTRAALPGMIARGRGAIVNVSSLLAFTASMASPPLPHRATYAGTKAYVTVFTQILQNELEGTGVQMQALCAGIVQTEFHERVGIDPARYPATAVMKPEDLVAASLEGLRLGEVVCVPGLEDPGLWAQRQEIERQIFTQSRRGAVAARYQS